MQAGLLRLMCACLAIGLAGRVSTAMAGQQIFVLSADESVQLTTEGRGTEPVVAPPAWQLREGQTIVLPEGAEAELIINGRYRTVKGPDRIPRDESSLGTSASADETGWLKDVGLGRQEGIAPGGTRGGGNRSGQPVVQRPLPRSSAARLDEIRWHCELCGEVQVSLLKMTTGATVWRGTGTDRAAYDGPILTPGEYGIRLNSGPPSTFTVVGTHQAVQVRAAVEHVCRSIEDRFDAHSAAVAIWWLSDIKTEALILMDEAVTAYPDDPRFLALRSRYESHLGQPAGGVR